MHKELVQVTLLLRYFKESRTGEVKTAYADLMNRAKDWGFVLKAAKRRSKKPILKLKFEKY